MTSDGQQAKAFTYDVFLSHNAADQPRVRRRAERLRETEAAYRLRMGDYRILFDVEDDAIVIRRIGNRKDVYD